MTVNRIAFADLPPPIAARPALDPWNSASASLPGLVNFLQPSVDTARIEADGMAALYDRKARVWWRSTEEVEAGVLGPVLQFDLRASLSWPETNDVNPLRSPADVALPAEGTVVLVVELSSYDAACTLFESVTTTGNYVKIAVNASGEIEVTGAAGATKAKTADITPYEGPAMIMFSWSTAGGCKVSLNGTIGATTSGAYVPNADRLDLGAGLDDGSRLHAALILDVDFHASAHDDQRESYITATGEAFGLPFEVEWDFADLGAGKLFLDYDPADLSDGDVASWTDAASGVVLTEGANRPSRAAADFNGHPSVTFSLSDADRLRNTSSPSAIPSGTATSEVHVLVDQTTAASELATLSLISFGAVGANAGRQIQRIRDGTTNDVRASTNNTGSNIDGGIDFSGKHVVGARWEAGVEYLYANGALKGSLVTPFNTMPNRVSLGCNNASSPSGFISSKVARVIGVKEITQAERDLIVGKLAWLGGIQSLLPAGHPYRRAAFV